MKKVKVKEINNYICILRDSTGKKYKKNIEFQGLNVLPNDEIYISEKILEEDNIYLFGPIEDTSYEEEDYIKVIRNDEEFYLQRYYG